MFLKKKKKTNEAEVMTKMSDIAYIASKNTSTTHIPHADKF